MRYMRHVVALLGCLLPFSVWADATSTFILPGGVEVTIVETAFHEDEFSIEGCTAKSSMCRINGRIPYGVAFGLPKTYVKSLTASFHGTSYSLDAAGMYNAWGCRPLEQPGSVRYFGGKCFDERNCQFRGLFSDAAGTFVAEWIIIDGYATRTILTSSGDVVDLFMKNIDPPEFD